MSARLLGFLLAAVLAVAVVRPLSFSPVVRDSSEASWMAGERGGLLVAIAEPVALERQRFDPLLAVIADRFAPSPFLGFSLYLAGTIGLALAFLFVLFLEIGLPIPWAAAMVSVSAIPFAVAVRLGHPLWLPSPWLVALGLALCRLDRQATAGSLTMALAALALLRAGSEPWFVLSLAAVAGFAAVSGTRDPGHARAALILGLVSAVLLWLWPQTVAAPADSDTLAGAPSLFTARDLVRTLHPSEIAVLVVVAAPAALALFSPGGDRSALWAAGFLLWASFSWRLPHHLRFLPPLRLWQWLPGGGEHAVPLLAALAALPVVFGVSGRRLAALFPAAMGWPVAALGVALLWTAPPPAPHPQSLLPLAPLQIGKGRVLHWPLDYDLLAERLALYPESPLVNVEESALRRLYRFAPPAEAATWSEDFWRAVQAVRIDRLATLTDAASSGPPGAFLAEAENLFRVDADRALARYATLALVPREGWTASSSTGDAVRLPESAAFDGRPETRWATGGPQVPGQYFELDLGSELDDVTRVVLAMGGFQTDLPAMLAVEIGGASGALRRVAVDARPILGSAGVTIDFPPQRLRRLRLVQLGRSRKLDWSIAEMAVFRDG